MGLNVFFSKEEIAPLQLHEIYVPDSLLIKAWYKSEFSKQQYTLNKMYVQSNKIQTDMRYDVNITLLQEKSSRGKCLHTFEMTYIDDIVIKAIITLVMEKEV